MQLAQSAMWNRIEDGKSPLPAFSGCAVDAEGLNHQEGYAAYIPPHQHCVKSHKERRDYTPYSHQPYYVSICDEFEDVPGKYLEGVGCRHVGYGATEPNCSGNHLDVRGQTSCIGTKRFIRILENGKQLGSVFYY